MSIVPRQMRLITWNVARRRSVLVEQATVLAARQPTVVALQEVTGQTLALWRRAFELMGLPHVRSSFDDLPDRGRTADRRRTATLLASRSALSDVVDPVSMPWPESAVAASVATDVDVDVVCVHVPNAANGAVKPETLRSLRAGLAAAGPGRRVICGDLNTPRRELPSGEVISFARDGRGRLRPDRGEEWDAAELGVVPGLRELGYHDVFRTLHGYDSPEPSWTWRRIAGHGGGWRLDHIFASAQLRAVSCRYHHEWRDSGLSDHSALEADLIAPAPSARSAQDHGRT